MIPQIAIRSATRATMLTCMFVFMLAGCSSAPDPVSDTATVFTPRDALAPRYLGTDGCGLFVWRNTPTKPFILFFGRGSARTGSAIWDGGEVPFTPTATPVAPIQTFTADAREWTLRLANPSSIVDGTRYDSGTLVTIYDGWEKRVPVVGLLTCRD